MNKGDKYNENDVNESLIIDIIGVKIQNSKKKITDKKVNKAKTKGNNQHLDFSKKNFIQIIELIYFCLI